VDALVGTAVDVAAAVAVACGVDVGAGAAVAFDVDVAADVAADAAVALDVDVAADVAAGVAVARCFATVTGVEAFFAVTCDALLAWLEAVATCFDGVAEVLVVTTCATVFDAVFCAAARAALLPDGVASCVTVPVATLVVVPACWLTMTPLSAMNPATLAAFAPRFQNLTRRSAFSFDCFAAAGARGLRVSMSGLVSATGRDPSHVHKSGAHKLGRPVGLVPASRRLNACDLSRDPQLSPSPTTSA
jgi:hypothetical protein